MGPPSQIKNFSEVILNNRNLVATASVVGALLFAAKAEGMVDVAQAPVPQNIPAEIFSAVGQTSLKEAVENSADIAETSKETEPQEIETHEELLDKDCTSIRRRENDIYAGIACKKDGSKYQVVYSHTLNKGWIYSAVLVEEIFKCGYIRPGILPKTLNKPNVVAKCREYFVPFTKDRDKYYGDYNCEEVRPELEGCNGPTDPKRVSQTCEGNVQMWGNFATAKPSPFNVWGTGGGGFSMLLPNKFAKAIRYRTQVKPGSVEGKAIVIRDVNNTPSLDWGFTKEECSPKDSRRGGPLTLE